MRIYVKGDDTHINLIFPTSFLCSKFCTRIISKYCIKDEGKLSYEQLRSMVDVLKRFRKKHKGWVLVDVESDGEKVLIKL